MCRCVYKLDLLARLLAQLSVKMLDLSHLISIQCHTFLSESASLDGRIYNMPEVVVAECTNA